MPDGTFYSTSSQSFFWSPLSLPSSSFNSIPAVSASLLFFEHIRHASISAPLHLLFPLPGMLFWVLSLCLWNRKQSRHSSSADFLQNFTGWGLPWPPYLMLQTLSRVINPGSPLILLSTCDYLTDLIFYLLNLYITSSPNCLPAPSISSAINMK